MNFRLQIYCWYDGKNPDTDAADFISSYHHSKYREAYLDFLNRMGGLSECQLWLVDLDNRTDWVIVDDSRWSVEE